VTAEGAGTILDKIVAATKQRIEEARARIPPGDLQGAAEGRTERRDFAAAIARVSLPTDGLGLRVIAELKRASPSRGLLRQQYRRREIALGYESAGAVALSVLTEEHYFLGALSDLSEVRSAVQLPVLRKDFILDPYQVYESVAAGADALLLITAALDDKDLGNLMALCNHLRIAALVEVHTEEELDRALTGGAKLVGVNNRNLKTLEVNLATSFRLREKIPTTCLAVSESGIRTPAELRSIAEAGYHAVLLGERLMAGPDPGKELAALLRGARTRTSNAL